MISLQPSLPSPRGSGSVGSLFAAPGWRFEAVPGETALSHSNLLGESRARGLSSLPARTEGPRSSEPPLSLAALSLCRAGNKGAGFCPVRVPRKLSAPVQPPCLTFARPLANDAPQETPGRFPRTASAPGFGDWVGHGQSQGMQEPGDLPWTVTDQSKSPRTGTARGKAGLALCS